MSTRLPVRSPSLVEQVTEILVERIRTGLYPANTQLPSESTLAAELDVSRATVRSALGALSSRGLVVPRQGVGTFVSSLPRIRNPLSQFISFPELIASNGLKPGYRQVSAAVVPASPGLAEALLIEPGSDVLRVHKQFTADGTPVIYVINHIPAWVYAGCLSPEVVIQPGVTQPIFDFLEERCGQRVERYVASVRAELMKSCDWQDSDSPYDPSTPVLVVDEIGFSAEGKPVHHSIEYHPNNWMTFEMIRSRSSLSGL